MMTILEEEVEIREELEKEIEKSMEMEIKDGICQLVLRLHRLYQHMEGTSSFRKKNNDNNATPLLRSEVWMISIRLEGGGSGNGGNKMDIKEIKREALMSGRSSSSNGDGYYKHKKLDWEKSLRRSSSTDVTIGRCGGGGYSATSTGSGQRVIKRGRRRGSVDRGEVKVWKY